MLLLDLQICSGTLVRKDFQFVIVTILKKLLIFKCYFLWNSSDTHFSSESTETIIIIIIMVIFKCYFSGELIAKQCRLNVLFKRAEGGLNCQSLHPKTNILPTLLKCSNGKEFHSLMVVVKQLNL